MIKTISILYVTSISVLIIGFLGLTLLQVNVSSAMTKADLVQRFEEAPIVTSDGNVYVTWWSNKTGNNEVMFRASNDGGISFGDKINLSNTTEVESVDAEIAADGENVYVTWWERNENVHPHTNEPVLRISNDGGQTFGRALQLSNNDTIGNIE